MPRTVMEMIRERLYQRTGIQLEDIKVRDPAVMQNEIERMIASVERISAIAEPRLLMGGIRYGSEWKHQDLMNYMCEKIVNYTLTGNFEELIDLFNLIAVEGELKTHPNHHFKAKDRDA